MKNVALGARHFPSRLRARRVTTYLKPKWYLEVHTVCFADDVSKAKNGKVLIAIISDDFVASILQALIVTIFPYLLYHVYVLLLALVATKQAT